MSKKSIKTIPFTAEKYSAMQKKVAELTAEQTAVVQRLAQAREMGDLSENGAYKYAKLELGRVRGELRKYTTLLQKGFVAPRNYGATGKVEFGRTVELKKNDSTSQPRSFLIVSEHESNPAEGKLSYNSPLGKALIRKAVGAVVTVPTPNGITTYTILSIS